MLIITAIFKAEFRVSINFSLSSTTYNFISYFFLLRVAIYSNYCTYIVNYTMHIWYVIVYFSVKLCFCV